MARGGPEVPFQEWLEDRLWLENPRRLANTVEMLQLHLDIEEFIVEQVARHAAGIYDDLSGSDSPRGTEMSHQLSGPFAMPMLTYPQSNLIEHRAWCAAFSAPSAAQESAHHELGYASLDASEADQICQLLLTRWALLHVILVSTSLGR